MITQTMIDLCIVWIPASERKREEMCPIIHDAFAEAGYPCAANYHFMVFDNINHNTCCANRNIGTCLFSVRKNNAFPVCGMISLCLRGEVKALQNEEYSRQRQEDVRKEAEKQVKSAFHL